MEGVKPRIHDVTGDEGTVGDFRDVIALRPRLTATAVGDGQHQLTLFNALANIRSS